MLEGLVGEYFGARAFGALTELHHAGELGPSGTSGEAVGDSS